MLIHQYDNVTGAYINSTLADPDPSDPQGWLVPAFSTILQLPTQDRPRNTWWFFIGGYWQLKPDYRGVTLYRQVDGQPAEILAPGIAPQDVGLTTDAKPGDEFVFSAGAWRADPAMVAAKLLRDRQAELTSLLAVAQQKNLGKSDAFAAGLLTAEQIGVYKAWAKYQMDLIAVVNSPDFPTVANWPALPDETAAAAQGVADAQNHNGNQTLVGAGATLPGTTPPPEETPAS